MVIITKGVSTNMNNINRCNCVSLGEECSICFDTCTIWLFKKYTNDNFDYNKFNIICTICGGPFNTKGDDEPDFLMINEYSCRHCLLDKFINKIFKISDNSVSDPKK